MAFFFSLLYVVLTFMTPELLLGDLGRYHVETVIALLAIISSVPGFARSNLFKYPQTVAMVLVCLAVPVSIVAGGWFGGAIPTFYQFLTAALPYFLVAANCRKRSHIQAIVICMFLGCMYFTYRGYMDLTHMVVPSEFLYGDGTLRRLRGLGLLNDPNDFSQVMVSLIPCMFLWWKPKRTLLNILLCGIPVAGLIYAMFLTHSRGASVALMAVILVASRRKIGTVPAAVMAGLLFVGLLATGWSGGRDVSMEAGADRMDAWSVGLELIKHHPLFGVGEGRFADFNDITAHNTVVVCAAEIGLLGFYCWVLFVFSSGRTAFWLTKASAEKPDESAEEEQTGQTAGARTRLAVFKPPMLQPSRQPLAATAGAAPMRFGMPFAQLRPALSSGGSPTLSAGRRMTLPGNQQDAITPEELEARAHEIRQMARILMLTLTGFLTAGWFLSRAFSTWLFVYGGMIFAVYQMSVELGVHAQRDTTKYLLKRSLQISIFLIILVYVVLKMRSFTGG